MAANLGNEFGGRFYDWGGGVWNTKHASAGLTGDGKAATGGAMTSGDATLTVTGGDSFEAGDVGKAIVVPGAGVAGALLTTTIATYTSATSVELASTASTTITTGTVTWGTDNRTALDTLVNTTIPSTGGTLLVTGKYRIASAITIPAHVSVHARGGGGFVLDSGVTMTHTGPNVTPPAVRQFYGPGTISFGTSIQEVFPDWWGATGDDAAIDTPAILSAIASISTGVIRLRRQFGVNATITLGGGAKSLKGIGVSKSGLVWRGTVAAPVVRVGDTEGDSEVGVSVEDMSILCPLSFTGSEVAPTVLLDIVEGQWTCFYNRLYVRGAFSETAGSRTVTGIRVVGGSHMSRFSDCHVEYCGTGGKVLYSATAASGANSTYFNRCGFMHNDIGTDNDGTGGGISNVVYRDCLVDLNRLYAMKWTNVIGGVISGTRFESNNQPADGGPGGGAILVVNSELFVDGIYITGNSQGESAFELSGNNSILHLVSGYERNHTVSLVESASSWSAGQRVYIGPGFEHETAAQENLVMDRKKAYWGQRTHTTTQAVAASTVNMSFDTEAADYGGIASGTTTSRMIATRAGVYEIRLRTTWEGNATGFRRLTLRKISAAGVDEGTVQFIDNYPPDANPMMQEVIGTVALTVGQEIEARAFQTSGATLNLSAQRFTMRYLGD